jgi:hypothetical protein
MEHRSKENAMQQDHFRQNEIASITINTPAPGIELDEAQLESVTAGKGNKDGRGNGPARPGRGSGGMKPL